LAARNVLLADDGVAKVADFGMSRKMYYEGNYQQSGQVNQKVNHSVLRRSSIHLNTKIDVDQVDGHRILDG
jgi:Protein tyrosine and serine/threonine kinase